MTAQHVDRYRWSRTKAAPTAPPRTQFRKKDVVGEVKPHNPQGIAAGIDQLVRWTRLRPSAKPQLVTYRQVPGTRTRYEVLAADVDELRLAISARGSRRPVPPIRTWYSIGITPVPEATRPLELWQCPAMFGNVVEKHVRRAYADRIRIPPLPEKDPSKTGPDIEHELLEMAEFLRELAAELEAEAGY